MFNKILSNIISKIKHEEYVVDSNLTLIDMFSLVIKRINMLIRGFFKKPFFKKTNGKRKYNLSNKDKALIFDCNQSDFQVAICACEYCGWTSKTITQ